MSQVVLGQASSAVHFQWSAWRRDTLKSLQATLAARGVELEVAAAEQFEQRVRANLRLSG